jgi:hemerythrin-like metal-binding protein
METAVTTVMDQEHQIQTGLLEALCAAVKREDGATKIEKILDQLVAYSSAHFMSEELLMRLASYDDYEDHVTDHIHMMDRLNDILAHHQARRSLLVLEGAQTILAFITKHIATRDTRFAQWAPPQPH